MLTSQIPILSAKTKRFLLLVAIVVATTIPTKAINPCWQEVTQEIIRSPLTTPYPLYVDTCLVNQGTQWIFALYAKQDLEFSFGVNNRVNSIPPIPNDSTVEITWRDIDTGYSAIRSMLSDVEDRFGSFYMRRKYPSDTITSLANIYLVRFSDYVNIDSVINTVMNARVSAQVHYEFVNATLDVPNDRGLLPLEPYLNLRMGDPPANNENDFWGNYLHRLGFQWNIWQQKFPMAWEITRGSSDIVICADDLWPGATTPHPDMGGFIRPIRGDGSIDATFMGPSHGLSVLALSIANSNNDNPNVAGEGMAGACPECSGIGVLYTNLDIARQLDVDGSSNGVLTHPDVLNCSYGEEELRFDRGKYERAIDSGIVVLAASGNGMEPRFHTLVDVGTAPDGLTIWEYQPRASYPAAFAYPDNNSPNQDTRVIAVGATRDGLLVNRFCTDWFMGTTGANDNNPANDLVGPSHQGPEQFERNYTFSLRADKFNNDNNVTNRRIAKENSYMDMVASTGHIFSAQDARPAYANRGYAPDYMGTSQAVPQVSGTVGLMRSINRNLGIVFQRDQQGNLLNGADVQRTAYNILTFTTDKVNDVDNIPTEEFIGHVGVDGFRFDDQRNRHRFARQNSDGSPIQFNYILQANDQLDRSWAQRMGFGRLNAYRAVAHAIANKGAFLYNTSTILFPIPLTGNGNVNERGENLMHMGAWFDATNRVLAVGGHTIPGTDPTHRNQGRTVINGTNTALTVQGTIDPSNQQQNSVLAIDGILTTDNPAGNNFLQTGEGGRILVTGYLDNVAIKGNTRISDLIMNADAAPAVAGISIEAPNTTSEIYGRVTMRTRSHFTVDQGTMVMQPGSVISMAGNNHVEVRDGGVLDMRSASKIEGNTPMKMVFVRNGSRLLVRQGAKVDLNCFVQVDDGGEFIVEAGAEVTLDRFRIQRGGKFVLNANSRLIMNTPQTSYCFGIFEAIGAREITSHVAACCEAYCETNDNRARIAFFDAFMNPLDISRCYVHLANTRVENVRMRTVNYPIFGGAISNVTFVGERSIASPIGAGPLLQMQYSLPLGLLDAHPTLNRQNIIVQACHFEDPGVPRRPNNNNNDPRFLGPTPMSGILATNLPRLTVVGSTFENLATGIYGEGHNVLRVHTSTFTTCSRGIFNKSSAGDICNNTFSRTEMPVFYENSLVGKAFDNRMTDSYVGIDAKGGSRQDLRGNIINNFQVGNRAKAGGSLNLDQLDPTITGGMWEIEGRNKFDVNTTVSPEIPLDPNGVFFPPIPNDPVVHSDIAFTADSKVSMRCGYNFMSEFTPFHLVGLTAGTPSIMDKGGSVDHNRFSDPNNPNGFIRLFNVNAQGWTLNVSQTIPPQCAPNMRGYGYCFASGVDEWMSWPGGCRVTIAFNDGSWISLPPGHPLLDTAFTFARRNMRDYTVSYSCRRTSAYDAVQAALLGDAVAQGIDSLLGDFGQMITDTATPDPLRTSVMLLKGELHERKGEFTDALNVWGTIVSSYPTSSDSVSAAWRIQALQAYLADTAQEYTYDSLMLAYHNRVLTDQRKLPLMPTPKRVAEPTTGSKPAGIEEVTLTQNRPNPFSDDTDITFSIPSDSHVLLTVIDAQGTVVATLVNEPRTAGKYSVSFPAGGLPSGTYIYRLSAAGRELSRTMQIVH